MGASNKQLLSHEEQLEELRNQIKFLVTQQKDLIVYTENIQRQVAGLRENIREERKDRLQEIEYSVDFWNMCIDHDSPEVISLDQFTKEFC